MTFGLRMQDVPCSHHSFILYLTDSSSTGFLASRVGEREVRERLARVKMVKYREVGGWVKRVKVIKYMVIEEK